MHTKRLTITYVALAAALLGLFALNLFWGSVAISPRGVVQALLGRGQDELAANILLQLRLPRAVMVVLLGAALSAAGYLLQTFFANPIAGPFVMGISSGAKLVVALTMVVFLNHGLLTNSLTLILAAFAGSMAAMAFVLSVARRVHRMSILVICGVMIGYICSAVTDIVVAFAQDSNIVNLHNWSMGSFSGMTWAGGAALFGRGLFAGQADGRLPDGGAVCPKRGCGCAAVLRGAGAAFQFAGRLRHGVCGAHFLCGYCGAALGQAGAGKRQAAACAAGLCAGWGGVLPAV